MTKRGFIASVVKDDSNSKALTGAAIVGFCLSLILAVYISAPELQTEVLAGKTSLLLYPNTD